MEYVSYIVWMLWGSACFVVGLEVESARSFCFRERLDGRAYWQRLGSVALARVVDEDEYGVASLT